MDQYSIEAMIGKFLNQRGLTLAAAESCTGGLVCHRITNVPGSSSYFVGGVVAYANETKMSQLGVRKETLDEFGAVSRETVIEMARGVRERFNADIGISISGIAGPDGGTPEKPVGLTWIALCAGGTEQAWQYVWPGNRIAVKEQSSQAVLQLLFEYLSSI
jgi:PncC family amidohydrolase